jgi:hypothetical protein
MLAGLQEAAQHACCCVWCNEEEVLAAVCVVFVTGCCVCGVFCWLWWRCWPFRTACWQQPTTGSTAAVKFAASSVAPCRCGSDQQLQLCSSSHMYSGMLQSYLDLLTFAVLLGMADVMSV